MIASSAAAEGASALSMPPRRWTGSSYGEEEEEDASSNEHFSMDTTDDIPPLSQSSLPSQSNKGLLVHETATLDYPCIVRSHGRAGGCESNFFCPSDGYFILLDWLKDTILSQALLLSTSDLLLPLHQTIILHDKTVLSAYTPRRLTYPLTRHAASFFVIFVLFFFRYP